MSTKQHDNYYKWRQKQERVEVQTSPQEYFGAEKNLRPYTLQDAVQQCKVHSTLWIMCLSQRNKFQLALQHFTCNRSTGINVNKLSGITVTTITTSVFSDRFALDGYYKY